MIKTAVVILNWNGKGFLKEFLPGVLENSALPGTAVYVADNGSTDGSAEWLELCFPQVKVIRLDKNHGFAGGYNLALEKIDADYFVLLNSDIEVVPGWLEPLVSCMDSFPDLAACQPKILSYHNRKSFEHAGAAGCFIDKFGFPFCRGRIFNAVEMDEGQYNDEAEIFWASGACMMVRAEAWKKCGGFDPAFFAHMEEIDLCWRFHKAGMRVLYIPASTVYHVGGGSLPYSSPFKIFLNFRNSLFMLYKNLPDKGFQRLLFKRKILDGVAAVFFLLKGSFTAFLAVLKAHFAFYRSLKTLREKRKIVKTIGEQPFNAPVMNKSIVFEFYIRGKRKYSQLSSINKQT